MLSGLEQRQVFGAKFFLQFVYLLGQRLFLAVFLLVGLVELITEIEDLAIGLGFGLIATDDADNLLYLFGSIGLLSLSKQRRRRNNQNPQDQQPVHKFPRDPQATIPQKTEESSKCHGKQVFELMAAGHFFFCLVMRGGPGRASNLRPGPLSMTQRRFPPPWSVEEREPRRRELWRG